MRPVMRWSVAISVILVFGCAPEQGLAPEVTLKLSGQFCESYTDAIKAALLHVEGVTAVDLESKKGHVVVTGDPASMREKSLKDAIDGVKGDGWYCEATVVR